MVALKVYCVRCWHRGEGRSVDTPARGKRPAFHALHPYRHKAHSGGGWCDGHLLPGAARRPRRS